MDQNKPLLTLAQVNEWEARCVVLADSIRVQTEEMNNLARKIERAKAYMELLAAEDEADAEETKLASSVEVPLMEAAEESISGAVLAAVGAMPGSPKPSVIRKWIGTHNPEVAAKLDASPAYLYTTLMRHVRAGRLAKRGKGYRLPTSPLKKGTGGDSTPSDVASPFTPVDARAVEAVAEAGGT
jgi:hypothetical protein